MMNIKRFHPGLYIKESLSALEMTAKEFAARTGISERTLSAIINGNGDITFESVEGKGTTFTIIIPL